MTDVRNSHHDDWPVTTAVGPSGEPVTPGGDPDGQGASDEAQCRFELAPPRHFVYPVLLLLVAEEPMHGYRLVRRLRDLRYGAVNRPNVYRALADLEHDRLVESWEEQPVAGSMRHVYGITGAGRSQLAAWMEVVGGERDVLDHVLARFSSIGDHDDQDEHS